MYNTRYLLSALEKSGWGYIYTLIVNKQLLKHSLKEFILKLKQYNLFNK